MDMKQQHRTDEIATNDTMVGWNSKSATKMKLLNNINKDMASSSWLCENASFEIQSRDNNIIFLP